MIYQEGQKAVVKVINVLPEEFGGDFVIQFPNGDKTILQRKYYHHYNICVGQELIGVIDKINCAGKIFFEPQHPYYQIGSIYSFSVLETISKTVPGVGIVPAFVVKDCFDQKVEVLCYSHPSVGEMVQLVVKSIRKGKIFLEFPGQITDVNHWFEFLVKGVEVVNGTECYVISGTRNSNDKFSDNQTDISGYLPVKWYRFHNISVGKTILCKVWFSESQNSFRIEPKHPCYEEHQIINFDAINRRSGVYVHDCFGQLIKVRGISPQVTLTGSIECKVLRIRKGKPVLVLNQTELQGIEPET